MCSSDLLVIYKQSAFELFSNMDAEVNKDIVSFLCHAALPAENSGNTLREGRESKTDMSKMRERKDEFSSSPVQGTVEGRNEYHDPSPSVKSEPVKVGPKVGRNDPCPCGSGKKYKACHGKEQE